MQFHRINGVIIAILALLHPLFVYATEDVAIIPIGLDSWPRILGAGLLLLPCLITASGLWRLFLAFSFDRWWLPHRVANATAVAALGIHVLFVSEPFESGIPRTALFAASLLWVKVRPSTGKGGP